MTETNIIALPPAQRAAVVLKSEAAENTLRSIIKLTEAITNVVDKNGRSEAHAAAMMLKSARVEIEKTGKLAREDATQFSKAVIAESARLIGISEPEEDRLIALRDGYDAKVAAEQLERDHEEALNMNECWVAPVPVSAEPEALPEPIIYPPVETDRPTDLEIADLIADHYSVTALEAAQWLGEIDHAALIGDLS